MTGLKALRTWPLAAVLWAVAILLIAGSGQSPAQTLSDQSQSAKESPKPEIKQPDMSAGSLSGEIADWEARWELARLLSYIKKYDESMVEY